MTLEKYAVEFVSICGFMIENAANQVCETNRGSAVYLDPGKLRRMLDKDKFEEADVKLRVWRNLGWLICDPGRLTKNIKADGKSKRSSVLNLTAFEQLRDLLDAG